MEEKIPIVSIMFAVITLFAMLIVEAANADQADNYIRNTQPPDTSLHYWTGRIEHDTTWRDTVYASVQLFSQRSAVSDSAERVERSPVRAGSMDDMDPDKRVAQKLTYGALWGAGGGAVGAAMGFALGSLDDKNCGDDDTWCGAAGVFGSLFVGSIGYSIGTAVGVSRVDPHDLFGASLIGSVVGFAGGIGLMSATESELLFPSLFIGPIVGATLASEWSRSLNPSDKKLPFFMNLAPDPRGRFVAIATLRF